MLQKLKNFIILIPLALLVFSPVGVVFAQSAVVEVPDPVEVKEEGWTLVPAECLGDRAVDDCGFPQVIQLVANVMGLLMVIALSLATLLFSFAGFKYVTAAGNQTQVESAKKIFTNVAIGLAVVFGAYLVVQVVVSTLGVNEDFNQFLDDQ